MKSWHLALLFVAGAVVASSEMRGEEIEHNVPKICIFAAAEKLPRIPGLVITGAKTSDVPDSLKTKGISTMIVEVSFTAAGQSAIAKFVCASAPGKPPSAVPLGVL